MRILLLVLSMCIVDLPVLAADTTVVSPRLRHGVNPLDPDAHIDARCVIKGNISTNGTKIFYTPDSANYHSVRVDSSSGEVWFCTEGEARRAGWRRAPR